MKTISIAEAKQYFDALAIQPSHEPISEPKTLLDFLGAGKAHSRFSSVEEIDAFVAGNREIWIV
jgi:hypothetical protein